MATLFHNIKAFVHHASSCLRESRKDTTGHSQAIRARHAREFLQDVGITYEGPSQQQIEALGPCIYVGNHTSTLDAVLICAFFEDNLRILAKESLFKVPWLGGIMRHEKHIMVHRGKDAAARNAGIRNDIRQALDEGASIFFFPEGTRSSDGKLARFKRGAFYNAVQNDVPIVPVVIRGTFEAMPKSTLKIRPGHCSLTLLDPVHVPNTACGDETTRADILLNQTYNILEKHLQSHHPA